MNEAIVQDELASLRINNVNRGRPLNSCLRGRGYHSGQRELLLMALTHDIAIVLRLSHDVFCRASEDPSSVHFYCEPWSYCSRIHWTEGGELIATRRERPWILIEDGKLTCLFSPDYSRCVAALSRSCVSSSPWHYQRHFS